MREATSGVWGAIILSSHPFFQQTWFCLDRFLQYGEESYHLFLERTNVINSIDSPIDNIGNPGIPPLGSESASG